MLRALILVLVFTRIFSAQPINFRLRNQISVGRGAGALALSPDHRTLYVTNSNGDSISIVDLGKARVTGQFQTCHLPVGVRVTQNRIFVGCQDGLRVIDVHGSHLRQFSIGSTEGLCLTKDQRRLFLASENDGTYVLDTETLKLTPLSRAKLAIDLALTPDEKSLYVSYQGGGPGGTWGHDAIAQLDPATGRLIRSITGLPNVGYYLAISRDGNRLWASGADACYSMQYDHIGCPAVPAGVLNIVDLSNPGKHVSLPWLGRLIKRMVVSPSGRWVLANGLNPVLYDQTSAQVVSFGQGYLTLDAVFPEGDNLVVVSLPDQDRIAIIEFQAGSH